MTNEPMSRKTYHIFYTSMGELRYTLKGSCGDCSLLGVGFQSGGFTSGLKSMLVGYRERDRYLRPRLRDLDLYLRLDGEREREREPPLPRLVNSLRLPVIPSREGK